MVTAIRSTRGSKYLGATSKTRPADDALVTPLFDFVAIGELDLKSAAHPVANKFIILEYQRNWTVLARFGDFCESEIYVSAAVIGPYSVRCRQDRRWSGGRCWSGRWRWYSATTAELGWHGIAGEAKQPGQFVNIQARRKTIGK